MRRHTFGKYAAIATTAARQTLIHPTALAGRVAFYGLILYVFSRLWRVALPGVQVQGASPRNLLWYLAITEWVIMSIPPLHQEIEKDIRSGDIVYRLPRPMSYLAAQLAHGAGELLVRMAVLGVTGFGFAYAVAGGLPDHTVALLAAAPTGLLACCLGLLMYCSIGLTAIWLQDVSPLQWVWQKLAFVFGGMLFPLDVYPAWLRSIAACTPFHAMLYGCGRMVLRCDAAALADSALRLGFWLAAAFVLAVAVYRIGLRHLSVNGG